MIYYLLWLQIKFLLYTVYAASSSVLPDSSVHVQIFDFSTSIIYIRKTRKKKNKKYFCADIKYSVPLLLWHHHPHFMCVLLHILSPIVPVFVALCQVVAELAGKINSSMCYSFFCANRCSHIIK